MRILHTSDWHLGRSFHGEDLLAAQACVRRPPDRDRRGRAGRPGGGLGRRLRPGAAAGRRRGAGRRGLPPARPPRGPASWSPAATTTPRAGSASTPGWSTLAGVHLRTDAGRVDEPVLLEDEHGPVAVYGIPYLEPDVLARAWDLPTRSHHAALGRGDGPDPGRPRDPPAGHPLGGAGARVRRRRPARARASATSPSAASRSCRSSCSTASTTPRSATCTAARRSTESVRYSGSPLAYSFSEADHVKGSWLVDLGADGLDRARRSSTAPVPRRARPARGHPRRPARRPRARRARGRPGCRRPSPTPSGRPRDGAAARPLPARPGPAVRARRRRARAGARPPPPAGRRTTIALDFVAHVRGEPGHATPSPTCCATALECCSEDPDLVAARDAVVSG